MSTTQNLLAQSETFNSWTLNSCTVNPNTTANPIDGTLTADTLIDTNDVGVLTAHYASKTIVAANLLINKQYTLSVYAKAGTKSQIAFSDLVKYSSYFDISLGTVLQNAGSISRIIPVPGATGWYRLSMTFTAAATTASYNIYITNGTSATYAGNGTGTVILYGAQLVQSNWEGNYYATVATANPYGSIYYKVPVKQNLFKYSEQFDQASVYTYSNATITANTIDTLDPIGTNTAGIVVENAVLGYHYVAQTPTAISAIADNTVLIASVYAKKATRDYLQIYSCAGLVSTWFNLATGVIGTGATAPRYINHGMVSVGNGWYRCWVAYKYINAYRAVNFISNTANSETTYQGVLNQKAIYLWGAQLEQANSIGPYTQTVTFPYNYGARRSLVL